jgi:predicted O-methyltransferase YrrM
MTKKRRRARPRHLPITIASRDGWGIALEVGGVVQSVSVPSRDRAEHERAEAPTQDGPQPGPGGGYWGLMLPAGCPRRALILGLGAGTVAHLLAGRCPAVRITGVERDAEVLAVARAEFGLDAIPHLEVIEADAFAWVETASAASPGVYDLVCLDLFEAGRLALGTLATPFLRQIAALLAPDGTLTVNLMVTARTPDQLHRLQRVFAIRRELRLQGNLVVHARALDVGESMPESASG